MLNWAFLDYVDSSGQNPIRGWLEAYPQNTATKIKSKCLAAILMADAAGVLKYPRFEKLQPPYDDLIRLAIEVEGVAHRIITCYGANRYEVWLLACGYEHNTHYTPPGLLDTAHNRRIDMFQGKGRVEPTCLIETN